jgi:hypothetical protein
MANTSTQKRNPRDRQRYNHIRLVADTMGFSIIDLLREFNKAEEAKTNGNTVTYAAFYRICTGERKSARIQKFIARKLRIKNEDLWA